MKNIVYKEMLYCSCSNKSLADAAGWIVINDLGEERFVGNV